MPLAALAWYAVDRWLPLTTTPRGTMGRPRSTALLFALAACTLAAAPPARCAPPARVERAEHAAPPVAEPVVTVSDTLLHRFTLAHVLDTYALLEVDALANGAHVKSFALRCPVSRALFTIAVDRGTRMPSAAVASAMYLLNAQPDRTPALYARQLRARSAVQVAYWEPTDEHGYHVAT